MIHRRRATWAAACGLLLGMGACQNDPVTTAPPPDSTGGQASARPLGLVEVTISGIGTAQMTATARAGASTQLGGPRLDLLPPGSGGGGNGTIQLQALSTGSFTSGTRGAGGVRYLWATYRVRNAQTDGTAYTTARTNLTFFAAATSSTLGGTAISAMRRFDGSAADAGIAPGILPTGDVHLDHGALTSTQADILQVISEAEVATIPAAAGVTPLPYGFVVHNATTGGRTLAASPAAGQYDGVVTFAFKYPLQSTVAQDPFTVSALFQAVDDGTTRITHSLEEQTAAGESALNARAVAIGATQVTLLPGADYYHAWAAPPRLLCSVRTAGTAAAPTASLATNASTALQWLLPSASAADGSGSRLAVSSAFTAMACSPGGLTPAPSTFTVNGSQSGRHFLGQVYAGTATATVATPAGSFRPGEEVEVTLTTALGISRAYVARYRVAGGVAAGTFGAMAAYGAGQRPSSVAIGDLNGDDELDLVVAIRANTVNVLLGAGDGTFGPAASYGVGTAPSSVAIGDLNGDGKLDLAVANDQSNDVSVLLGDGTGSFAAAVSYAVTGQPSSIAIGDLDGDGWLDLAVAHNGSQPVSVLLNAGGLGFAPATTYAAGSYPMSVAIGDVNGDGKLDLAVTSSGLDAVSVLLGAGNGTFGPAASYAVGSTPYSVAIGDLNADGKLDLAVANNGAGTVSVLLGDGSGSFAAAVSYPVGGSAYSQPFSIAIGDLNGDGQLDLAVANNGAGTVSVLLGAGDGTFGPDAGYGASTNPRSVAIGDLDGDGKLDLAVASWSGHIVGVRLGQ